MIFRTIAAQWLSLKHSSPAPFPRSALVRNSSLYHFLTLALNFDIVQTSPLSNMAPQVPDRVGRLCKQVDTSEASAFVMVEQANIHWSTGYIPAITSMPVAAIALPNRKPVLFLNALRVEEAKELSWASDIKVYGDWLGVPAYAPTWNEAVVKYLTEASLANDKIGVEDNIPDNYKQLLQQGMARANLVPVTRLIDDLRMIKDEDEIESALVAGELAGVGAKAAIEACKPGVTELGVQWAALRAIGDHITLSRPAVDCTDFGAREGGVHYGQQCWVVAGKRRSMITPKTSDYVLQDGDLVTVGFWTVANHIHAEQEITVAVGQPTPEDRHAVRVALQANEAAFHSLKIGVPLSKVEEAGWAVLEENGAKTRLSRAGHTVGLSPHEPFSITKASSVLVRGGMLLAIEPHYFRFEGKTGQISNTVAMKRGGPVYTTLPFSAEELGF